MTNEYDPLPNKRLKCDYETTLLQCVKEESHTSDDSVDGIFIKSERDLETEIKVELEETVKQELKAEPEPSTSSNHGVNHSDPESIWSQLFTDEILTRILHCTNIHFVKQRLNFKNMNTCELRELDMVELKSFIGLLLFTSIFRSNQEDLRWIFATDGTGRDVFRCTTSGNRFAAILASLRFDDASLRSDKVDPSFRAGKVDPLAPISGVFNLFVENCQRVYPMDQLARIDEICMSFRDSFMNRSKIFALTDAKTGFFFNGYIHTGKESDGRGLSDEEKRLTKSTQRVLRLVRPVLGKNVSIIADERFFSLELINWLKDVGIPYVGTPDKHCHDSGNFPKKKTKDPDKDSHRSESSCDYNLSTNCAFYSTSRRTKRWPMAFFFKILDICSFNSYVLYRSNQDGAKLSRYEFIKQLGMQLIAAELRRRLENIHMSREVRMCIRRILKIKENSPVEDVEEKLTIRKTCKRCPAQRNRKTAYFCIMCKIPVCLECTKKICKDCAM